MKVNFKELDKLQKKTVRELCELLVIEGHLKNIKMAYTNIGHETLDREIIVHIYTNDYNYKQINLRFSVDINAKEYFKTVMHCIENKKYTKQHSATAEEIYLHRLIEEYNLDFYVYDGELYREGEIVADLNEVVSISKDEYRIVIEEERNRAIIDLETNTYYSDDIEYDDSQFIYIDKEILESEINELNSKTNDTHYFIKNNMLWECNIKERIQLIICELECIRDFGLTDDYLFINLKDEDTIHLTKEGSCM